MADKIVNVPGVGNVAFPDTMDDNSIAEAIKKQSSVPSLLPQGTAPTSPATAQAPGTQLRDLMGTGSNVLGMGASGAQLGAMFGPIGAAAGGVAGGALGAFLPPSDAPVTDLGATALDLAASRVPGGGRMIRLGKNVLATGLGAALGAQGDKALGFQQETPWGRISVYSALATPGAIMGSLASEASPVMQAAGRLKGSTGVEIPLSTAEATGRFSGLESMLTSGSTGATRLGFQQDAAARLATEKLLASPFEKSLDVVLRGTEVAKDARGVMNDWRRAWQAANPKTVTKEVESPIADSYGRKVMNTVTTTEKNPVVDWSDFQKFFGLTREERNGFFKAIRTNPDAFVNQFLPGKEDQVKGLVKLRAVMTVLDKSGHKAEAGQLGQAVAMRYLRGPFELGQAVDGKSLALRIESALGSTTEPGHLTAALGPKRAEALRDLATVLKEANPLEKVSGGTSVQKRAGQYLGNKAIFTTASAGAMALAGSQIPVGNLLLGMTGGAVVGIGIPTILGALMSNPQTGKILIRASKGDAAATGRLMRTITSAAWSEEDREETTTAPTSRLQGLFKSR
jgi:hypothetical protein